MSNEIALDWMVHNVHEWPYPHQDACYVMISGLDFGLSASATSPFFGKFTSQQWLARRAELQNKPSWEGAPEWATYLAQGTGGDWCWFGGVPEPSFDAWEGGHLGIQSKWVGKTNCCEVLGSWRDTLERRPESFKPITSIEDNQEQVMVRTEATRKSEKQQDNGWFERGELPPVGVVCETLAEPELQWVAAEVVAHRDGFAIVWVTSEKCGAQCDDHKHFRPIRTERELAIDEMMEHCKFMGSRDFAGSLFDAGYRKESK